MDFQALFAAEYVAVHRYLAHRLGDAVAAEDLAAETFLRAYRARESFVPGSPRAWLFAIATNLVRDHARGSARREAALATLNGHAPPPAGEPQVPDPELTAALATLRPEECEALLLLAWAELSYEEIATATGVPVGTVRSRLSRARAHLTAVLGPERSPR